MTKHLVGIALRVLSVPVLCLSAYGVAQSVSDHPPAQAVIAASFQSSSNGADDPAGHDLNRTAGHGTDDVSRPPTAAVTSTTVGRGPDNDADDQGAPAVPGISDDGAGHDVGDDLGGPATTTGSPVTTASSGGHGDAGGR